MPAKCTLRPADLIAQAPLLSQFDDGLTPLEEEQVVQHCFAHYLFYDILRSNHIRYLCTTCGDCWEEGRLAGLRHNEAIRCPRCGAETTAKALGRLGSSGRYPSLHEEHNAVFLRPGKDGALLISAGRAAADYQPGELSGWPGVDEGTSIFPVPTLDYWERRRYYLKPSLLAAWKRHCGRYTDLFWGPYTEATAWEATASAGEPNPRSSGLQTQLDGGYYFLFGWEALAETELRYSAAETYFALADAPEDGLWRGVVSYLAHYARRPQLEMLVKLGHQEVVTRLVDHGNASARLVNWRAKAPHAFFRLSKADYRAWHEAGAPLELLEAWHAAGHSVPLAQLVRLPGIRDCSSSLLRRLWTAASTHGVTLERLMGYLARQTTRGQGIARTANLWLDYLRIGTLLDLDWSRMDVILPRDLEQRHDNAAEQVDYQDNMEALKRYRRRAKILEKRYALEAEGYLIRVPRSAAEIRREGRALAHCVGGYAARHLKGIVIILFLRRADEPDTPLCTIEMEEDGVSIRQIHGYQNDRGAEDPRVTYQTFLSSWLGWLAAGSRRDAQGRPLLPGAAETKEAVAV